MSQRPITMRQLAEHLGFSKSTVSMALQGKGRVSDATRQRVKKAAQELGYQPDPLLSAFSRRRGKNVSPGSVIAFIRPDPVRLEIHEDLRRSADNLGYRFERFALSQQPSQGALVRILRTRGVAGVFFAEIPQPIELEPGVWDGFAGVYCGPYPAGDEACPFDTVRHNPFDAVLMAWTKAVAAGCERIALLLPTQNPQPSNLELKTLAAYRLMQEQSGEALSKLEPLLIQSEVMNKQPDLIRDWYAAVQPDVILGGYYAVYPLLCNHVPDFSPAGQFISLRAPVREDDVAGCLLEREVIAEIALRRLHALIQDPAPRVSHSISLVINPTWKPGASFPE